MLLEQDKFCLKFAQKIDELVEIIKIIMVEQEKGKYTAKDIKVLEGLEGVRRNFDIIELSKKIKKKGDILILSNELKIKPRSLMLAVEEGKILSIFPNISKSKTNPLSRLRTDRELKIFEIGRASCRERV